jgi:hypothetical protein
VKASSGRRPELAFVALAYKVAVLIAGLPLLFKGVEKVFTMDWSSAQRGDCAVDWEAARLFFQHKSPYSAEGLQALGVGDYGMGHPPTTSFWFLPFTDLSWPVTAQLVGALSVAAVIVTAALCAIELALPSPLSTAWLVAGLTLNAPWMADHLTLVQLSAAIGLLYAAAWYWLRRGSETMSGAAIGIACTLKLFPGVMIFYFAATRRWRAVVAAAAVYLPIALIVTSRYGLSSWPLFFKQQGPIAHYWIDHMRNASLHGIIIRLFRPCCEKVYSTSPLVSVQELARLPHLPPMQGRGIAILVAVLVLGACIWLTARRPSIGVGQDLGYALFTVLSAFLNPWIWEHYDVILLLPLMLIVVTVCRQLKESYVSWASDEVDARALGLRVLWCVFAFASLAIVIWSFKVETITKERVYGALWGKKFAHEPVPSELHRSLHFYEVLNWLPWPIATGLLLGLLSRLPAESFQPGRWLTNFLRAWPGRRDPKLEQRRTDQEPPRTPSSTEA